jgi:hypothetical protein
MTEPARIGGTELQFKLLTIGLYKRHLTRIVMTTGYIPGGKNNAYITQMKKAGLSILSFHSLSYIDYRSHPLLCGYFAWLLKILGVRLLHLFNPKSMTLATIAKKASTL